MACGIWGNCKIENASYDNAYQLIKNELLDKIENGQRSFVVCCTNEGDALFIDVASDLQFNDVDFRMTIALPCPCWVGGLPEQERERRSKQLYNGMSLVYCTDGYTATDKDLMYSCSDWLLQECDEMIIICAKEKNEATQDMILLADLAACPVDILEV